MKLSPTFRLTTGITLATLLTACSSSAPKPPPPMVFDVTAEYPANNGHLFYFVVRSTNEKQFMLEGYQDIANKTFADPPDPNVLGVFSIVPGQEQECSVNQPTQGGVALYFLLTQPGPQWKKLLSLPLMEKYDIDIPGNNQVQVKEHKSFWSWL